MNENNNQGQVFLNGRAQVLEIFQHLTSQEKERLLKRIRPKDQKLASELAEESIQFKIITTLKNEDIKRILSYVKAPILGVALKSLKTHEQRKILSLCPRQIAEEAFRIMTTQLTNESSAIKRACARMKSLMAALSKKDLIQLSSGRL